MAANDLMKILLDRGGPPVRLEDEQDPRGFSMPTVPLVTTARVRNSVTAESATCATVEQTTRDRAIDADDGLAVPASPRSVQPPLSEKNPNQTFSAKPFVNDSSLVVPVIASPDEILRARELRQQLKKKYLNQPSEPSSLWCIGVD